jgi:hypothetical protein
MKAGPAHQTPMCETLLATFHPRIYRNRRKSVEKYVFSRQINQRCVPSRPLARNANQADLWKKLPDYNNLHDNINQNELFASKV